MQEASQSIDFAPQFVAMLAAGVHPTSDVLASFGVTGDQYAKLQEHPAFRELLARFTMEYQEKGVSAQLKAALSVELLIPVMYSLATNEQVDPKERKSIFDSLMKLANLSTEQAPTQGPPVAAIQIVLNQVVSQAKQTVGAQQKVLDIQPAKPATR